VRYIVWVVIVVVSLAGCKNSEMTQDKGSISQIISEKNAESAVPLSIIPSDPPVVKEEPFLYIEQFKGIMEARTIDGRTYKNEDQPNRNKVVGL